MCNSVEIPHQLWKFHTSFGNLTSVMWVSKKPQCECGPFSMSSYNSTQWVWNPLFPHHCRGNSTDLRLVGDSIILKNWTKQHDLSTSLDDQENIVLVSNDPKSTFKATTQSFGKITVIPQ